MGPTYSIFELDLTFELSYLYIKFGVNRIEIAISSVHTHEQTHTRIYVQTYTHTYRKSFQPRDRWRSMTPRHLGLFVIKLQSKVCLSGYDIPFAYYSSIQ